MPTYTGMRTMMRSAAAAGLVAVAAVTVGTLSTPLAARAGALPAETSGSGAEGGNGVRVEITDDTRSAHSGDVIDYTVRVENDSPVSYPHLEVFHLVPAGFQLVDSSPEARQEGSNVRWIAAAAAGRTLVFTDQVMAGTVEESQHVAPRTRGALSAPAAHQFSSTACARGSATGPALACAMVREQLTDGPDAGGPAPKHWQPGLLGIGLVAALFAACGGLFRKRRDRGGVEEG
ncbi:MAG: DUF11 domain-containing protein [Catenulisporales bacterium]|nr:DUF11 domain-containing protein [Catenulisporales bacterium]